jgi:hypothetical protein
MRTVLATAAVVVAAIVGFFLVGGTARESRFKCEGRFESGPVSEPMTVFLEIAEYRWWIGLWSDSNGSVRFEVPTESVDYAPRIADLGERVLIYGFRNETKGQYTKLSQTLSYELPNGVFEGPCKAIGN